MKKQCSIAFALIGLLVGNFLSAQTQITFYTNYGDFVAEMSDSLSPITSGNFIDLVESGFYDGLTFHRVIDDFVIQGGDPTGTGNGDAGYVIEDEFDDALRNVQGTLSMANEGPDTGSSQFFINLVDNDFLDFDQSPLSSAHPVFGSVIANFEVVQLIGEVNTDSEDGPIEPVIMDSLRVTTEIGFEHEIDAGIVEIRGLRHPLCDGLKAELVLKNLGRTELTEVVINYQVNGGNPQFLYFEGSLNPGQSVIYEIESSFLLPGINDVNAYTTFDNGQVDENPDNDGAAGEFLYAPDYHSLEFSFTADSNAPKETTWALSDSEGTVLREGGNYSLTGLGTEETWCLEPGCYSLKIQDAGFNGMDNGAMLLSREIEGETVILAELTSVDFGSQERFDFCTDGFPILVESQTNRSFEIVSSPVSETLILKQLPSTPKSIELLDTKGAAHQIPVANLSSDLRLDVSGFAPGLYWLRIKSDFGTATRSFVIAR